MILKDIYRFLSIIKNKTLLDIIFNIKMFFRFIGICDIRYKGLKKYKNAHLGSRCFIVATGPSLTIEDLLKLKDEITFGMNSLCTVFAELQFETTYFGIQDYSVYTKLESQINAINISNVFIGDRIEKLLNKKTEFNIFPLDYMNHKITYEKLSAKFSPDIYYRVYDGYTITYSILQIVSYMGFKEVYLVGADCNYSDDKTKHHFSDYGHYDPTYKTAGQRMIFAYKKARAYADSHNIKIYNATRGGMLEVFPRVDLDEVLGLSTKEIGKLKDEVNS
ncbi:MAG: hypothetical protein JL56_15685 [Desulfotomaculum sp. BICA1-6]|nr:MAG: hypothetical protein JL56_15685 [Desulfotomaculum sp. BICA1-6]